MTNEKKLQLLEEMMDMDAGSLVPEMELSEVDEWGSLAKLSLIVLMDEECDKEINFDQIKTLKTVKDIMDMMD